MTDSLIQPLQCLYDEHLRLDPGNAFIAQHAGPSFIAGSVQVFRFYEPHIPPDGRVLDWGCNHAPDSCMLRHVRGPALDLHACDVIPARSFPAFFDFSRPAYTQLTHPFRLPYGDEEFSAVIASGVLEHVPMDYESLKELHRILRPGGRLVVTYLPNAWSVEEWWLRRRGLPAHERLYRLPELRGMLLHSGFLPLVAGYQTRLDLLGGGSSFHRWLGVPQVTSCLCAVATRVSCL